MKTGNLPGSRGSWIQLGYRHSGSQTTWELLPDNEQHYEIKLKSEKKVVWAQWEKSMKWGCSSCVHKVSN